nr:DnaJ domain-containing protein [Polymorphobacter sp.]
MGEFRAPRSNRIPGSESGWQFLCLEHVRAFNAGYNFFDGLSPDEIVEAQSPLAGWERAAAPKGREAFTFGDHHDLFTTDSRQQKSAGPTPRKWSAFGDAQALQALGLTDAATATDIRRAYKRLVRRYHPDSNEGDRSMEGKLQAVVNAYTHLKSASAFQSES